ncbi:MAG: uroporphyrinogen-III synthase [Arenicellales bacterium WSBS_2016_MAG_OTU3]
MVRLPADGVIFMSANAVRLELKSITAGILAQTCAGVGSATAHSLKRKGLQHVLVPTDIFNSEALLKLPELNDVASKQFCYSAGQKQAQTLSGFIAATRCKSR